MEQTHLLFLLFALLHVCTVTMISCPDVPDNNLTCYTDYNSTITCEWNGSHVSDHTDDVCTIDAQKINSKSKKYGQKSCTLEPFDVSKPALKNCTMDLKKDNAEMPVVEKKQGKLLNFQSTETWAIGLRCNRSNQTLNMIFKPVCNIKLNPPRKPDINFTTVSWSVTKHPVIKHFRCQLQWKQPDQLWSDPSLQNKTRDCGLNCETELDLIRGERYEARVRVQSSEMQSGAMITSMWSDWSPTTSWVSLLGKTKRSPDAGQGVLGMIIASTAAFALCLAVALFKMDKTTWVYKKIKGPPIPNPGFSFLKDANIQNWLSPHFTSESFNSFLKPVDIASLEVISAVDVVAPCELEAALLEKMRSECSSGSSSSSFSNPSYSHLCSPPPPPSPISSLSAGNLQPCSADTPYGPVGSQGEPEDAEQNKEEERRKETEILQLFSKSTKDCEPLQVISEYEKVEKLQVERMRLHSLDSGVCSGEEVSQESLEADSINTTDSHDENPEDKEKEVDFQKLFEGSGSIQVCLDYERVQKLQAEFPSMDSGDSSGGEEQVSQEENLEDGDKSTESTSFLFPPPSFPLPHSLSSFSQSSVKFSVPGLSPALRPLTSQILGMTALLSVSKSVEPSSDGYMPVKQ